MRASYGYEEFMVGLRPEGKEGGIEFKPREYYDKIGDIEFFVATWDTGESPNKASQKLLNHITDILKS